MGFGDCIMATAFATHGRVRFTYPSTPHFWNEIFAHHPHIAWPQEEPTHSLDMMKTGEGYRWPEDEDAFRISFRPGWKAPKGRIFLTESERAFGTGIRGGIVIEPNTKQTVFANNKQWRYWQELVDENPQTDFVQLRGPFLNGVRKFEARCFRDACAALKYADGAILPEGGLHHAAAALDVPAVVIFGAFSRPDVMGYDDHINVWRDIPEGLGARDRDNPHCRKALDDISVEEVSECLYRMQQRPTSPPSVPEPPDQRPMSSM